jgi:hypothetical protein
MSSRRNRLRVATQDDMEPVTTLGSRRIKVSACSVSCEFTTFKGERRLIEIGSGLRTHRFRRLDRIARPARAVNYSTIQATIANQPASYA